MQSDRELLELAAKAAEYDIEWWPGWPGGGSYMKTVVPAPADPILSTHLAWNPLTDDGDALRLAVKLKIDLKLYDDHVVAWFDGGYIGTDKILYGDDPQAATRRAIVCAAAETDAHPKQHNDGGAVYG